MAPLAGGGGGGGKRKRGDRSWSGDTTHEGQRPSPHRPSNLHLAQHNQGQSGGFGRDPPEARGRGGRRPSRGSRGPGQPQSPTSSRNPLNVPKTQPTSPRAQRLANPPSPPQTNGVQRSSRDKVSAVESDPAPLPNPRHFGYSFVTDELCQKWTSSGRPSLLGDGIHLRDDGDTTALGIFFQELLWAGMSDNIPPSEAGGLIREIAWPGGGTHDAEDYSDTDAAANMSECQLVLLDTISVVIAETNVPPHNFSVVIQTTGIPPALLRQELDIKFLEKMGLIRTTFGRMAVRKTTNLLYRQANFNLLREESEGFAKLMTELFTTSGNEPPTAEVVEDTVERVKAMIGSFDLDVGRALDVVLDVFGAVLVKQFRFFVKFLRASPWWPREGDRRRNRHDPLKLGGLPQWALPGSAGWLLSDSQRAEISRSTEERDCRFWARAREVGLQAFYEIGRQRVDEDPARTDLPSNLEGGMEPSVDEQFMSDWIKHTGTMPPGGNKDAAQLLGFKLRFYSSSVARTDNDTLPDNLIYLSALLIKVGFISLKDLYSHIWRADEEMESLRLEKVKEKSERERAARPGQGVKNALLMAGALADDTLPVLSRLRESGARASTPSKEPEVEKSTPPTEKKDVLPEPADQKIPLLKSLLAIGAIPESLFILGKFPWIIELYPELPEYINRIIHHALSKVYGSVRPLASNFSLQHQQPSVDSDITAVQKGQVRLVTAPPRKVLRWALLDRDDSGTDGLDYRFYWDEWSDNIPVCQSVDDVFTLCDTFVTLTGIKIGQDPALLVKLARIGKHSIVEDSSVSNRDRWIDLCKRLLVPALSLTKSNPGVVHEVYELLNRFSTEAKYLIYQEWSGGRTSRTSDMKTAVEQAKAETRNTLKRLSKTNIRPMARALAKIAYSNPHIVINTAISQIEVYDNLAEVFVEGARYFTDLGYDVLTWALISALGRAGRSRVQESGLVTSRWLTALAYFAGKMFKRYNIMRPAPVLQYVTDQLMAGNPTDLIVLEQIILFMAGIVTDASYNDAQLLAMGGGKLLRSQTILQLLDRRHECRLTSRRLMKSLKESDLAGKLLLAIAIQKQASIFNLEDANAPLKLLGNLYDEIQRVLTQYLDLLHSNLVPEEFEAAVPDISDLIVSYKVQAETAFWISRPIIAKRMADSDRQAHATGDRKKVEDATTRGLGNGDVDMADQLDGAGEDEGEAVEAEVTTESAATPTLAEINGVVSNPESPGKPSSDDISAAAQDLHWHPVLQSIMEAIKPSLPSEITDVIGLGFYVTFWQLALYDVTIPGKSYEDELSRQHKRMATISGNRADVTAAGARKREAEKKQISDLIDQLLTENKEHLKAFGESKARLSKEKDQWFVGMHGKAEMLNQALIEHCFLPRILLSPLDSVFCFKFLKFLHTSGTSNFRTMGFYDLIFKQNRLTSLIFMCTSKEADNLGRFLSDILRDLARWQKDRNVYEKEAWGSKKNLTGFALKVTSTRKPENFLAFEDFRRLLYKWHQLLFAAFQTCLLSDEYMHIRNAISVLKAIVDSFPAINFHGSQLQKMISKLGQSDQGDIRVPSLSLMGDLNKAEKSWILPQAFRQGQEKASEGSTSTPKASTPISAGQSLTAEAADLKPSTSPSPDGSTLENRIEMTLTSSSDVTSVEMKDVGLTEAPSMNGSGDAIKAEPQNTEMSNTEVEEKASETKPSTTPTGQDPTVANSSASSSGKNAAPERRRVEEESTPNTTQSRSIPPRPEPLASPRQPPPHLPDRPERPESRYLRPGDARIPNRPPLHVEHGRDWRDSRHHDRGGPPGRYDENHQEPAEYPPSRPQDRRSERMEGGRDRVERARSPERNIPARYPHDRRNQPLLTREDGTAGRESERYGRLRAPPESSRGRTEPEQPSQERGSQASPIAPPRGGQSVNTDSPSINPDRAALMGINDRDGISIRGQGEERTARGSHPTSPKRDADSRQDPRHDRREERLAPFDRQGGDFDLRQRERHDGATENGPRGQLPDRPNHFGDNLSSRDNRRHASQQYPEVDMNHGRLNQDDGTSSRHEQPSEVAAPSQDVPSGPRSRNPSVQSRGRNATPSQPALNTQLLPSNPGQTSMSAPDRPAPTGPASSGPASRSNPRSQGFLEAPASSAPPPPADTSGVHPTRLPFVSPLIEAPPQRLPSYPSKPSPLPTPSPSVPSGPRGSAPSGAPSGPAPTSRGPPSGPQGNSRNNRNPLAAVNNTLQQAGQGQSIRGRGGNRTPGGMGLPHSSPSTPTSGPAAGGPRSEVSIPISQDHGRPDLFSGRGDHDTNSRRPPPSQRRDEVPGERAPPSGRRGDLMEEAGESRRTSSRHSGSGRAHSPDGDGSSRRSEREHRDREGYRNGRDGEGRDYIRDRERGGDGGGRDRHGGDISDRPSRDSATSRHPEQHPPPQQQQQQQQQPPRSGPPRGSTRRDDLSLDHHQAPALAPFSAGPLPPGPPSAPHDDRGRRRGGYHSQPGPLGPPPSRPEDRERERERDWDRDQRSEIYRAGGGGGPTRDTRNGGGPRDMGDHLPPRKHPRADDGAPYGGGGGSGGGRGGTRVASESKRPRRGG